MQHLVDQDRLDVARIARHLAHEAGTAHEHRAAAWLRHGDVRGSAGALGRVVEEHPAAEVLGSAQSEAGKAVAKRLTRSGLNSSRSP